MGAIRPHYPNPPDSYRDEMGGMSGMSGMSSSGSGMPRPDQKSNQHGNKSTYGQEIGHAYGILGNMINL